MIYLTLYIALKASIWVGPFDTLKDCYATGAFVLNEKSRTDRGNKVLGGCSGDEKLDAVGMYEKWEALK